MSGSIGQTTTPPDLHSSYENAGTKALDKFRLRRPVRASRLFDRIVESVAPSAAAAPAPVERRDASHGTTSALVAEDSTPMHEVLITQFELLGVAVTVVGDGAQAVAAVEHGDFDLV